MVLATIIDPLPFKTASNNTISLSNNCKRNRTKVIKIKPETAWLIFKTDNYRLKKDQKLILNLSESTKSQPKYSIKWVHVSESTKSIAYLI